MMNEKEVADLLRKFADNPAGLRDAADKLDPKPVHPVYPVGVYVLAYGFPYIIADKKEWLDKGGLQHTVDNSYLLFTQNNTPVYCGFGEHSHVVLWKNDESNPYLDKNGNPCPKEFSVRREYEKGKIYKTFNGCIRIFDGSGFFMPGQETGTRPADIGISREATDSDITDYFCMWPKAAMAVLKEFVNTMK
jgi:hypothetical protein